MPPVIRGSFKIRLAPEDPTNLYSDAQTESTISLRWTNNHSAADLIQVIMNESPIADLGAFESSYLATGLEPGIEYSFRVVVSDAGGSGASNTIQVSTSFGTLPSFYQNPQNKSVEDGQGVTFQAMANDVTEYKWQSSPDNLAWSDIPGQVAPYYSFTAALADDGKYYRCVAINPFGEVYSSSAQLTVSAVSGVVAVTDLSATVISDTEIQLDWTDASASETGFRIYRDNVLIHTTAANVETYNDSPLTPGQSYSYRVDAFDGATQQTGNTIIASTSGPQIASSPTDDWTYDGGTVTFGVALAPNQGSVTYQWEEAADIVGPYSNIIGATSQTYSKVATPSDDGKYVRVKCTTGAGTVTSEPAKLNCYAQEQHQLTESADGSWAFVKTDPAYLGDCCQIRNAGGTTLDIGFGVDGRVDKAAIEAHAGGQRATLVRIYGQGGCPDLIAPSQAEEPFITDASGLCVTRGTNTIFFYGEEDVDRRLVADYTGSPIDANDVHVLLLHAVDHETKFSNGYKKRSEVFIGSGGLLINEKGDAYWTTPTGSSPYNKKTGARYAYPAWLGYVANGKPFQYVTANAHIADTEDQYKYFSSMGGAAETSFTVSVSSVVFFSEIAIFPAPAKRDDFKSRVFRMDKNYCLGPRDDAFGVFDPFGKDEYKLLLWHQHLDSSDFRMPYVASKGANSLTIQGVDWSWIEPGSLVKVGRESFFANGKESYQFTAVSGSYANGQTTITINESAAPVSIGLPAMISPHYDGSSTSYAEAARIAHEYKNASNSNRNFGSDKGDGSLHRPPEWYRAVTPASEKHVLTPIRYAGISNAAPDSTGLPLRVMDDGINKKMILVEYDVSGIALDDIRYFSFKINELTAIAYGTGGKEFLGARIYADTPFNEATVTWNNCPITVDPKPAFDDRDRLELYRSFHCEMTQELRAAVQAGASTITILFYYANDLEGAAYSTYELEVADISDISAIWCSGGSQTASFADSPLQLDKQWDATHHNDFGRSAGVHFWENLPLASGKNGNPVYGIMALARRGIALGLTSLVRAQNDWNASTDARVQAGGLWASSSQLHFFGDLMDEGTRAAWERAAVKLSHLWAISTAEESQQGNWNNANQCCKGIEGGADLWRAVRSAGDKEQVAKNVRRAALGLEDADVTLDPPRWRQETAFLRLDGMVREGVDWFALSPECDYLGRSSAHIWTALGITKNSADWQWLRDWSLIMCRFYSAGIFEEGDNEYHGPSGFGGRAKSPPLTISQHSWFTNMLGHDISPEFRFFARNLGTGAPELFPDLESANAAAVSRVNSTGYFTENTFNFDGEIREEPYRNFANSFCWPAEYTESPITPGWEVSIRDLMYANDPTTFPEGTKGNWTTLVRTFPPVVGQEDFVVVQKGAGDKRSKYLLQGGKQNGGYGGTSKTAHLHCAWRWDYGMIVCSAKAHKNNSYGWGSPFDQFPAPIFQDSETIIGVYDTLVYKTEDGGPVLVSGAFSTGLNNTLDPSVRSCSWNGVDTLQASHTMDPVRMSYGWLGEGDVMVENKTYRILDFGTDGYDGIKCDVNLTYSGSPKTIKELYHNIPLCAGTGGNNLSSLKFSYWNGSAWIAIVGALFDTWISGIQWIRLEKDKGDGVVRYAWIKLDSARKVKFPSVEISNTGTRIRRLQFNIHPTGDGTDQALPASTAYSFEIIHDDPGFSQSNSFGQITAPNTEQQFFEGEQWMIRGVVAWGPKTADSVEFEYSTDYAGDEGAATWNSIGTATPNGDYYDYSGGIVPVGVLAVRIKCNATDLTSTTTVSAITSKAKTLVVSDTFTDVDATLVANHTPDTNTTGSVYVNGWQPLQITSNSLNIINASPDNGSFASIECNSGDWVMAMKIKHDVSSTENDNRGAWLGLASGRKGFKKVQFRVGNVAIRRRDGAIEDFVNFPYASSLDTWYWLKVQKIGELIGFQLYDNTKSSLLASGTSFDFLPVPWTAPSFGLNNKAIADELEIWT